MESTISRQVPSGADLIRAAIKRSPRLQAAVASRSAQWSIQTIRGACAVRPSAVFIANQMLSPHVRWYRLRDSGLKVALRHRSRDVAILNEIFGGTGGVNGYAPPPAVADLLDASHSPRILDLGANIGLFGLYMLGRWPAARLTAFEPDPDNATLLEQIVAANELQAQWQVRRSACSNQPGTISFAAGRLSESRVAQSDDAGTIDVAAVDVFDEDHAVHLAKIDIEGAEWSILTDPRLPELQAHAIVLEWHTRNCPQPDPRATAAGLLGRAGYTEVLDVAGTQESDVDGVIWAWRPITR